MGKLTLGYMSFIMISPKNSSFKIIDDAQKAGLRLNEMTKNKANASETNILKEEVIKKNEKANSAIDNLKLLYKKYHGKTLAKTIERKVPADKLKTNVESPNRERAVLSQKLSEAETKLVQFIYKS